MLFFSFIHLKKKKIVPFSTVPFEKSISCILYIYEVENGVIINSRGHIDWVISCWLWAPNVFVFNHHHRHHHRNDHLNCDLRLFQHWPVPASLAILPLHALMAPLNDYTNLQVFGNLLTNKLSSDESKFFFFSHSTILIFFILSPSSKRKHFHFLYTINWLN